MSKSPLVHKHDFRWWGDDPYLICECGEVRDALNGQVVTRGRAAIGEIREDVPEPLHATFDRVYESFGCPNCGHRQHEHTRCTDMADDGANACACSWPDPYNYAKEPGAPRSLPGLPARSSEDS